MFHQSTAALDEPVSGCLPDPTDTHTHATLINPIRALRAGERQGLFGKWGVLESWETSTTVDENRVASIRQRMSHFVACAPLGAAGKGQDFYHGVGSAQFLAERKVASSSSVTEIQRRRGASREGLKPEVINLDAKNDDLHFELMASRDPRPPSQHHHACLTGLARRTGTSVGRHMRLELSSAHQPVSPSPHLGTFRNETPVAEKCSGHCGAVVAGPRDSATGSSPRLVLAPRRPTSPQGTMQKGANNTEYGEDLPVTTRGCMKTVHSRGMA
ncbi:hypothetical protein QBC42DRAFT_346373 [Cladorrhinum samala]|uniref:Uncharacterized protein n=1 Tax=Cladorrhinum samala TaxID=585594 RepID=A0AAV9HNR9_9PEZI|nr:hypothetical protein QBC42DRAFT_346373 [Cladorrhinum samala]